MGDEVFVQYGVSVLRPMRVTCHESARLALVIKCRGGDWRKCYCELLPEQHIKLKVLLCLCASVPCPMFSVSSITLLLKSSLQN